MALTNSESPSKEWYTQKELATALGRSISTVRNWRKRGVFKATRFVQTGAGAWLISREEFERLMPPDTARSQEGAA